ncbi:glycosyltransferase family 2 protein [Gordonia sp. 'Campus']|uniref:glycosyltransferase family 2 protein n=1 Tax=Gordonia sp. 'Campus' TaxID=2915824 RepID=UPI001EE3F929|nr:glycosyltransferase family 2 protein [Gordonia sp. 'Campus']
MTEHKPLLRRVAGGAKFRIQKALVLTRIRASNALRHRGCALGDDRAPIVSMTSYGDRLDLAYYALESILMGRLRPSRIILWVDDRATIQHLPRQLRRLQRVGLEVRLSVEGVGPHTKYFDALQIAVEAGVPLVTADDDTIYPVFWLHQLFEHHLHHPDGISCYRARRIGVDTTDSDAGPHLLPYAQWPLVRDSRESDRNFVCGVSGALYPLHMVRALIARGTEFKEVCPSADDVWINHTALQVDVPVRVVGGNSRDFISVEAAQSSGLKHVNVSQGRNDVQIAAAYQELDRKKLAACR